MTDDTRRLREKWLADFKAWDDDDDLGYDSLIDLAHQARELLEAAGPPSKGCINCGETHDGGYETEEVGPFCSQCWESLKALLEAAAVTPEGPICDLAAYGAQESTAALQRQDREQYQFWQGWNAALERAGAVTPEGAHDTQSSDSVDGETKSEARRRRADLLRLPEVQGVVRTGDHRDGGNSRRSGEETVKSLGLKLFGLPRYRISTPDGVAEAIAAITVVGEKPFWFVISETEEWVRWSDLEAAAVTPEGRLVVVAEPAGLEMSWRIVLRGK
jgi:hypothetical protein